MKRNFDKFEHDDYPEPSKTIAKNILSSTLSPKKQDLVDDYHELSFSIGYIDLNNIIDDCRNLITNLLDNKSKYMLYLTSKYFNSMLSPWVRIYKETIPWSISIYYTSQDYIKEYYDIDEDVNSKIYDIKLSVGWITNSNYYEFDRPTNLLVKHNYNINCKYMFNYVIRGTGGPLINLIYNLNKSYINIDFIKNKDTNIIIPKILYNNSSIKNLICHNDDIVPYIGTIYETPSDILYPSSHKKIHTVINNNLSKYIQSMIIYYII